MEDIQLNILDGILLFIIITVFLTRFFVKRKVKRMMMAMSDEQRTDSLRECQFKYGVWQKNLDVGMVQGDN